MTTPALLSLRILSTAALVAVVLTCSPAPAHAQGVPGVAKNKCLAGKNKCVSNKLKGLLTCREKCQKNPKKCGQEQTDCEAKVIDRFDGGADPDKGCFAKLEAKEKPSKPDSICTTTGDAGPIEARVDGLVAEIVATLEGTPPPATCSMVGLDLSGRDLSGVDLSGCDLTGAGLAGTDLAGSDLSGANLSGADMVGVHLSGTDLSGADLSAALLVIGSCSPALNLTGATYSPLTLCPDIAPPAGLAGDCTCGQWLLGCGSEPIGCGT